MMALSRPSEWDVFVNNLWKRVSGRFPDFNAGEVVIDNVTKKVEK
jgi:hypothetical protein